MAILAIAGIGTAVAAEHHVTINTSCGYVVDMVYDTEIHTTVDMDRAVPDKGKQYLFFGDAEYRISYRMVFTPDADFSEDKKEATTVLLVGKGKTLFADYYSLLLDSVGTALAEKNESANKQMSVLLPIGKKIKFKPWVVNNHTSKGKSLIQQNFGSSTYRYEDSIKINWILCDSSMIISGYSCKKATCTYRGRTYSAWYSPEVPLNAGPYVFNGLPGLIFSISDSNNEFIFQLIGLQKLKDVVPMKLSNRNIVFVSRTDFRKIEKNLADNPGEALKMTSGKANISPEILKRIQPKPYNPIEKE